MSKAAPDATLDTLLAKIATATHQVVCSGEPANYAGIAAVALASKTTTVGLGNGDYTAANGDTSGRKVTMTSHSGVSISSSGTATHIAYDDGTNLVFVTTCTSQVLTSGGTVTIPAHKIEVADPS